MLYDAAQSLGPLVMALAASNEDPRDAAAYALAYRLAVAVDQAHSDRDLAELSAKLMTILDAIHATPKSRAGLKNGTAVAKQDEPVTPLARLRAVHAARPGGTSARNGLAAAPDA